jgi:hypothetical protein
MSDRARPSRPSILSAVVLAASLALLVAAPAIAAKPGGGGSTSSSISFTDGVFAGTSIATKSGSTITWAHALCYKGGTLVYEQYLKYGTATKVTFTLGPTPMWTGGGATCTGQGGYFQNARFRAVATDPFTVTS